MTNGMATFLHVNARPGRCTPRRAFLARAAGVASGFVVVPRHVLGGARFVAPSGKVNVALVGAGGQGRTNARALFNEPDAQLIAVADPVLEHDMEPFYYKGRAGRRPVRAEIEKHYAAKTPNHRCAEYEDFRVLLEKEKAVDAVLCATPDHLHVTVSLAAMRAGKHVYCEKPLTHNVREARLVARVARETGVATQMGNLGHSREGIRLTCEWIWDGAIGLVREVHAWVGAKRWNKELIGLPPDTPPVPSGVNWDLWLGPRAPHPYHPAYCPVRWRDFWAFGLSGLGDFGCHDLDAPFWALDLGAPARVEALAAGPTDDEIAPHGLICYFDFPGRGNKRPPVRVTWYDGGLRPARPAGLNPAVSMPTRGVLFVGDKGVLLCEGAGGQPRLLPDDRMRAYVKPPKTLPRVQGHHRDWLDACKGGAPASSNFGYGARLTELTLLGVLALRLGQPIAWDPAAMKVPGLPAADPLLNGTYRKGWELA